MEEEKIISNTIRRLRFFANEMTQQELADRTGVTRQTIVAIENGSTSRRWSFFPDCAPSVFSCRKSFHTSRRMTRYIKK
ncbi:MAG: helix-turn-helix domain-containing protein [Bacteroidales bacterium]